ncbi:MAG TPA: hypothetical protein PLS81_07720 [Deltaproteobacteria bacterium]|nr:hypothetical protein [Deltaproteobacteria bacterium]HOM29329.1 hypothetical protein [Deltaproteobacteria bacterium]HPP81067.1 hypothetical protein [Deltaproteobacteria bacterium]
MGKKEERLRTTWISFGAVILACTILAFSFAQAQQAPATKDTMTTVMRSCSACHDTARVCRALGTRDAAGWERTIKRMVAKGASLGTEDIQAAAGLLATLAPGSKPVCK